MMHIFDVVVIGAGAAGLFCAGVAGQSGLKVLLVDHTDKIAEKIRISGGGRCNFTNLTTSPANFLGQNPKFCRSALAGYTPGDFIDLVRRHEIGYHEKHKGQLFCDRSAQDLITMLLTECGVGGVVHWQNCPIHTLATDGDSYLLGSAQGAIRCRAVVIATGGLSIPKIGATDFGYRIARQFGLPIVDTRPALVPLVFDAAQWAPFSELSGLSLPVAIETGSKRERARFREDLLFTHRGLSGPAVLQISSYWQPDTPLRIDLAPDTSMLQTLVRAKGLSRKLLGNELSALVPSRLADTWIAQDTRLGQDWHRPIDQSSDKALAALAEQLARWELTPSGTEGYAKAEVTAGGVDTRCLSSQTMESTQPGLYFIGEVVDVTGWLGGYNFQWAWASAHACANGLVASLANVATKAL
jgi:predicted Rossmann fold flavoprotein